MFWLAMIIVPSVLWICTCISDCVRYKYKYQNTCCCDTCPYRDECLEVNEDDR